MRGWQDDQPDKLAVQAFFNDDDQPADVYAEHTDPNEVALHIQGQYWSEEDDRRVAIYTNPIKAVQLAHQLMEAARKALVVPEEE